MRNSCTMKRVFCCGSTGVVINVMHFVSCFHYKKSTMHLWRITALSTGDIATLLPKSEVNYKRQLQCRQYWKGHCTLSGHNYYGETYILMESHQKLGALLAHWFLHLWYETHIPRLRSTSTSVPF